MNTRLYFAILSFCPDLTDPDAESLPVGIVGSGTIEGGPSFYFSATTSDHTRNYREILGDRVSESIMSNFHQFIQDQIMSAQGVTADQMMYWLQDRLRNSLHISDIQEKSIALPRGYTSAFDEAWRLYRECNISPYDDNLATYPDVRMTPFDPALLRSDRAA